MSSSSCSRCITVRVRVTCSVMATARMKAADDVHGKGIAYCRWQGLVVARDPNDSEMSVYGVVCHEYLLTGTNENHFSKAHQGSVLPGSHGANSKGQDVV